jgi:hypothetical protein
MEGCKNRRRVGYEDREMKTEVGSYLVLLGR